VDEKARRLSATPELPATGVPARIYQFIKKRFSREKPNSE